MKDFLKASLSAIIDEEFGGHPFLGGVDRSNVDWVLANYLAMSQAFPHLQAGAQKDLIFHYMDRDEDVPPEVERTAVVGSFLCWDEWGGHHVVGRGGQKALAQILDTARYFHSNLLRGDVARLLGGAPAPRYSPLTRRYLTELYAGLSSVDHVERCAAMVAFERHADRMISALWESVSRLFAAPREELLYFKVHVGGDDPAEAYHVEMTSRLVKSTVPQGRLEDFWAGFRRYYALNSGWCRDLTCSGEMVGSSHGHVRRLLEA